MPVKSFNANDNIENINNTKNDDYENIEYIKNIEGVLHKKNWKTLVLYIVLIYQTIWLLQGINANDNTKNTDITRRIDDNDNNGKIDNTKSVFTKW